MNLLKIYLNILKYLITVSLSSEVHPMFIKDIFIIENNHNNLNYDTYLNLGSK